jgi:hypothetical protein
MDRIYEDLSDRYVCVSSMDGTQSSGNEKAAHKWTSDGQEITALVEAFISQDAIPTEVTQNVIRLQESGDSYEALRVILNSLD